MTELHVRAATTADLGTLASFNEALIRDEGHRNAMTWEELEARMREWLASGRYVAHLLDLARKPVGYALHRDDGDHIYLRQLFVDPACRRRGVGRRAVEWLASNPWQGRRVHAEVLVSNATGIAFWRSVGFCDYCVTMEREP